MRISEVSPNTLEGSFSRDLILSKLWLIKEISNIKKQFDNIYVLGSWYGNLSIMLISKHLEFDKIINVEIDPKVLKDGRKFAKKIGMHDRIIDMLKDANDLDYRQVTKDSLIINTSTTNMENDGWFDAIPKNTLVALQGRNNDPSAVNQYLDINQFKRDYPLREIMFEGSMSLKDPETEYDRYMIIGLT
jgi:hypothetical protein